MDIGLKIPENKLLSGPEEPDSLSVDELQSEEAFENYIKDNRICIIHFYSPRALQCIHMNDVLNDLSKSTKPCGVKFAKLNIHDVPAVCVKFDISAVPVIIFIRNKEEIDRINGANAIKLANKVETYVEEQFDFYHGRIKDSANPIEERMRSLVNRAPCMLFMKGSPQEPRCGYSRKIVSILNDCNIDYKTYDILRDEEAREHLKKIFMWPTYPQLYLHGELLGGVDITEELKDQGVLKEKLPQKKDEAEKKD